VELFDASASHRDGAVALAAAGNGAFAASTAWRRHEVKQDRWLTPAFDAGYDADGDALTLTIAQPAAHGAAHADQAALQATYQATAGFLGADAFTLALSDGEATAQYQLELDVSRILVCQVSADCGGGDVCSQGVCTAPAVPGSGGGCTSGAASAPALLALLALGMLRRRREEG
jgi:Synergist-CTERM protein sorting domain-containing protein